ncbi:hypothetical protein [Streptomyces sp. NPDC093060]|uniref:hypothetical protein n=1 Tax=Streptomyces sp. NPDC093060 TaxID=3366019 RepID=UPI0038017CF9
MGARSTDSRFSQQLDVTRRTEAERSDGVLLPTRIGRFGPDGYCAYGWPSYESATPVRLA